MRKFIVTILPVCLFLLMLPSCDGNVAESRDELVVEGWITSDGHPYVMLHKSYNIAAHENEFADDDSTTLVDILADQMVPWAKVRVTDGEDTMTLTGRYNGDYVPPITYTSIWMDGTPGKEYTLIVDYKDYHATATSKMLLPVPLDSVSVNVEDSLAVVYAYTSRFPQDEDSYYLKMYCMTDKKQYLICPLGTVSSETAEEGVLKIRFNPQYDYDNLSSATFKSKGEVNLRLARITKELYIYFTALTAQLVEQGVFYMPQYGNIPTTIEGGLGYWAAMAVSDYTIRLDTTQTYCY